MKRIIYIIIFFYYSNFAYSQTNFLVKESGSATAQTISLIEKIKFTKTKGSWKSAIIYLTRHKVISNVTTNNSLTLNSSNVLVNNGVKLVETNTIDTWGNSNSLYTMTLPTTMSYNDFTLTLTYSLSTKADISTMFNPLINYPLSSSDVSDQKTLGYLDPTTNIESNNTELAVKASSIINGATDLKSIVELLASWIAANISYNITSTTALNTYHNKFGNCQGQSCLMIAFCRSLGIPARISGGDYFEYAKTLPIDDQGSSVTFAQGTNGTLSNQSTGHALYEIYYPNIGWVRGDPAGHTINFSWPELLKNGSAPDPETLNSNPINFDAPSGSNLVFSSQMTFSTTVTGFTYSFTYSNTKMISGRLNGVYTIAPSDKSTVTGLNDNVTIQEPPSGTTGVPANTYLMTPCLPVSFYAFFLTESTPATYTTGFDWSIILYHSGGEYVYAQQNGLITNVNTPNNYGEGCSWQPTISALPDYNWAYDPSGNIYGKVTVTVHISDGDTKYYETSIGVSPNNNIQNVTYTTNTTVNACAKLILTNVAITGTPTVIFNTNGQGITINGPFQAPLGSTVIINK